MFNLTPSDTAFPAGSLVLVTGATGFIATHIVDQLLLAGYHVRGTVRDEKKVTWTTEFFSARYGAGKFSAVIVPEMSVPGAFDEATKGVQGVIHTASNVTLSPDPNEVIPSTVAGVISILKSAAKESSVKSFVYTSSLAAASLLNFPMVIDSSTWNDAEIKEAWSITSPPFPATHANAVYSASKAEAERALWKCVKEDEPHFRVNTVLPYTTFGEVLSTQGTLSTGGWTRVVYNNNLDFVKQLSPAWFVDVKDVGRLHVAALLSESVKNERVFASAAPYTWNQVLDILRKLRPSKKFVDDIEGAELSVTTLPTKRGNQLLQDIFGRDGFTSLEESISENVQDLA